MKVALYYPWIYLTSGAERVILELTGRSRHEWTLFTSHYEPQNTFPGFAGRTVVQTGDISVSRSIGTVLKSAWKVLNLRLPLEDFDVLLVVCEGIGDFVLFRNSSCPALCVCLTPLRLVFDPEYQLRALQGRPLRQRLAIRVGAWSFYLLDRLAWKRYARVFCISEEVKKRVISGKLTGSAKLEVSYVGLGFEPPAPSGRFERFFFLPGRIMWTKNIQLGINAFREFREQNPEFRDFRLVVAGIVDQKSQTYYADMRALAEVAGNVEFWVFPSDAELSDLYSRCYGVLFTAFNEDWGIVPLESMAFGKPAICVNRGGPRESVQDNVDGFLEPPEVKRFAIRMAELAGNPARAAEMGRAGHVNVRRFNWNAFTKRIDDEIDLCVSARARSEPSLGTRQSCARSPIGS